MTHDNSEKLPEEAVILLDHAMQTLNIGFTPLYTEERIPGRIWKAISKACVPRCGCDNFKYDCLRDTWTISLGYAQLGNINNMLEWLDDHWRQVILVDIDSTRIPSLSWEVRYVGPRLV